MFIFHSLTGNVDKKSLSGSYVKSVDKSILDNPDAKLHFPEIVPYIPKLAVNNSPQPTVTGKTTKQPFSRKPSSYDSSNSLCGKIGDSQSGLYPVYTFEGNPVSATGSYLITGIENYPVPPNLDPKIGGKECLGRCGKGCTGIVTDGNPINTNKYSEDCLDHDMCATPILGGGDGHDLFSDTCNLIFSDAANDLLSFSLNHCEHDLQLVNHFVSNDFNATEQGNHLKPTDDLYLIYRFTNAGDSKLPHDDIWVGLYVDGELKGKTGNCQCSCRLDG